MTNTNDGAKFTVKYVDTEHEVVGVPIMELRDARSSAMEEVAVFTFGNFLASGSLWLGIERLVTEQGFDWVALLCGVLFVVGVLLIVVGFRQAARRVTRLLWYVPKEMRRNAIHDFNIR